MKDFAKSIVCNTKAEVENFEDKEKAKSYIQTWERRRDNAKRALQNAEAHLKEAMKHRFGDKDFQQREIKRYQDEIKAAEAEVRQYDDLIKSASKSTFGNSKCGNSVTEKEFNTEADLRRWCMDHNYTYTPVGGGYYRLEDDKPGSKRPDLEAHVKTGNSKVGNAYQYAGSIPIEKIPDNWRPEFPKAGYVVYYAPNKAKWFATEAEAKKFAESQDKAQKTGNSKVGNADPRIASLKQKLQALIKQDDTGALKDVLRLTEDTIKDLKARKEKLMKDVDEIEKDLIGWQDIKTEAKWNL